MGVTKDSDLVRQLKVMAYDNRRRDEECNRMAAARLAQTGSQQHTLLRDLGYAVVGPTTLGQTFVAFEVKGLYLALQERLNQRNDGLAWRALIRIAPHVNRDLSLCCAFEAACRLGGGKAVEALLDELESPT